ncbi:TMEM175 family protein [Cedecea sp. NFIX57]|uniref:TMEM175 family protein n=1 Tax=Cedecea sp. NFIX57 TaxID=1566286 RepID=UPI000A0D2D74|nr:TMEM175 family protein [Cedecea sp. NFIX57]SMG61895.1 Uncharacterized membrane protein [Cedecea sp. NFIX57]
MNKNRIEAFSDGVMAIILTIMVLELKVPLDDNLSSVVTLMPMFLIYVLSFIYIGLYWNNHHNLFQLAEFVDGKIMWSNLYLLFWISLIPMSTAWVGKYPYSEWPSAFYGVILFAAGTAHYILVHLLVKTHKCKSSVAMFIGNDWKGKVSLVLYLIGILTSFFNTIVAFFVYFIVTMIWIIPDSRFERKHK